MKPITLEPRSLQRHRSSPLASIGARAGTVAELLHLLAAGKRWWLLPMAVVLLASAALLVVVAAVEYVAPFVYTIFLGGRS